MLFDAYQNLLTDIQRNTFIKYFLEDYSLSEVAELTNISKASVSDNLRHIEKKLINLEDKLHFVEKNEELNKIIVRLEEDGQSELASEIKKIYE